MPRDEPPIRLQRNPSQADRRRATAQPLERSPHLNALRFTLSLALEGRSPPLPPLPSKEPLRQWPPLQVNHPP